MYNYTIQDCMHGCSMSLKYVISYYGDIMIDSGSQRV